MQESVEIRENKWSKAIGLMTIHKKNKKIKRFDNAGAQVLHFPRVIF